jgi:prepilin-type N-terminal cleavage/methylation domain-containing protein
MCTPFSLPTARRGFTLIELMIVVVIIGVLAALAIPHFSAVSKRSKEAEAAPLLKQLYTLQERHRQQDGEYATDINDLEGADSNFPDGKYYHFALGTASGTTYIACATPLEPSLGLRSQRITNQGVLTDGGC